MQRKMSVLYKERYGRMIERKADEVADERYTRHGRPGWRMVTG